MKCEISIAITGGIGSGKSVVCRILACMGYPVYDCDSRAKYIMDHDINIKAQIAERISPAAVRPDGSLDRAVISAEVFGNAEKLNDLNAIVHGAVRDDICAWLDTIDTQFAFIETAILYQSGLDRMVDRVWEVEAPEDVRITRVCRRNGFTPQQVQARIDAQRCTVDRRHPDTSVILNDDCHSLLLQIHQLLKGIR